MMGRTKKQALSALKSDYDITDKRCSEIRSADITSLATELGKTRQPASRYSQCVPSRKSSICKALTLDKMTSQCSPLYRFKSRRTSLSSHQIGVMKIRCHFKHALHYTPPAHCHPSTNLGLLLALGARYGIELSWMQFQKRYQSADMLSE